MIYNLSYDSEEEVMIALKSFRSSSAGVVDGQRPGHLKDLLAPQIARQNGVC